MSTSPLPFPHPASPSVGPVVPLPAGVRIDRFVIEQTLHHGPHGFAYRVRESGHQQPLVLLECFPRALAIRQPDGAVRARQAGDAIALSVVCEAFVQDARALAAVDHPGVVKVYGIINANRTVYRLMPYIDGRTLEEQRLEREDPPTVGGLMRLYDKLLDALEALHGAGFVHGQVQPDQILVRRDDNAPVLLGMDGVAMELGELAMSPWAAPEQQQSLRFERVNASADLYMLAATMCFAATGAAPPRAEERLAGEEWDPAALLTDVTLGGGDAPALRDHLIQAVTACLALAPAARPQRASDVRHILHPRGEGGFVSTSGPVPLWVGEVPDRDSQWETLESMSGPAPLRDEPDTELALDFAPAPSPVAAPPVHQPARPSRPAPFSAGEPGDPVVERMSVRTATPSGFGSAAARRADDLSDVRPPPRDKGSVGPPALPRWVWYGALAAGSLTAALVWWVQRDDVAPMPPQVQVAPATDPPAQQVAVPTVPAMPPTAETAPAVAPRAASSIVAGAAPAPVAAPAPAPVPAPAPTAAAATEAAPAAAPAPPLRASTAPSPAKKAPTKTASSGSTSKTNSTSTARRPSAPQRDSGARTASSKTAAQELCANRTNFSYLYCMREACARAANRSNAQCVALRRSGDVQ